MIFSGVAVSGVILEIANPAASGVTLAIKRSKWYSLLANQIKIVRTSAGATGGTSTAGVPSQSRDDTTPIATVKSYTVAPTPGTLDDVWDITEIPAATTQRDDTVCESAPGLVIQQGEWCEVIVSAASTTVEGYIEWYEDPV
jgi:hypothetical protein